MRNGKLVKVVVGLALGLVVYVGLVDPIEMEAYP